MVIILILIIIIMIIRRIMIMIIMIIIKTSMAMILIRIRIIRTILQLQQPLIIQIHVGLFLQGSTQNRHAIQACLRECPIL